MSYSIHLLFHLRIHIFDIYNTEFPEGSPLFSKTLLSQSSKWHTWDKSCIYSESSASTLSSSKLPGRSVAASAMGLLFLACPGRVARRSLPLTARAASRPRAPSAPPLPQRSHGRRGPVLPGRLCRELPHSHAAASPQPRPTRYPGALPDARVLLPAQRRALGPRRAA